MTRKVYCPVISSKSFVNMSKRLNDESLTYNIWDKVRGNVDDNGVPYLSSFMKLDSESKQAILDSLNEEEKRLALQNIEKEEVKSLKYNPLDRPSKANRDFSYTVKTSDGKRLSLMERTAAVDAMVYEVGQALLNQSQANVLDVFGKAKSFIRDVLKVEAQAEVDKLSAKEKLTEDEKVILSVARISIRSYEKMLDPVAWEQLQVNAKTQLELNGIRFRSRSKSRLKEQANLELTSDIAGQSNSTVDDANDEDAIESAFDRDDSLGRDPKDYSSSQIKALMMGIIDPSTNNIGVEALYDQSRVYKEVLMVLTSQNDFSEEGIMRTLKEESEKHPADNFFEVIYEILSKSNSQQLRIQFQNAMNQVRNNPIAFLYNSDKSASSRVAKANNGRIEAVVLKDWYSDMGNTFDLVYEARFAGKPLAFVGYIKSIGEQFKKDTKKIKEISKTVPAKERAAIINEINKNAAVRMMNALGITLSENTYSALMFTESNGKNPIYSKKNGYNLKSRSFQTAHQDSGVFGSIASLLVKYDITKINDEDISSSSITDKLITDLSQTAMRFLAGVEGKGNNRYFQNNFIGLEGKARYNYKRPTPNDSLGRRLFANPSEKSKLASAIGLRKLYILGDKAFGGAVNAEGYIASENEEFSNGFEVNENYASKEYGTNTGSERSDQSKVDLEISSLHIFQDGGSFMNIMDTTKSDKKGSPIFKVPRVELPAAVKVADDKYEPTNMIEFVNDKPVISRQGKTYIMESEMMDNCLSVVAAELDRMKYVLNFTGDPAEGGYDKKITELELHYGKDYLFNAQFFYSATFLNNVLPRNPDGTLKVDRTKGLAELNLNDENVKKKFKEALFTHFKGQINSDLETWLELGLLSVKNGKYSTNLLSYDWARSKGYAPFQSKTEKATSYIYSDDEIGIDESELDEAGTETPTKLTSKDIEYLSEQINIPVEIIGNMLAKDIIKAINKLPKKSQQIRNIKSIFTGYDRNTGFNSEMLRVLTVLSLESNMNSFAVMGNFGLLMSGDPAASNQSLQKTIKKEADKLKAIGVKDKNNVKATDRAISQFLNEYQKRLSSDISPATDAVSDYTIRLRNGEVVKGGTHYRVAFIADSLTNGADYLSSFPKEMQDQVRKYTGKGTDGLEFVSFYNKLDSLYRTGVIKDHEFVSLRRHYAETGEIYQPYAKHFVIGAGKPRQVSHVVKKIGGENVVIKVFIKSAEFPLYRELAKSMNADMLKLCEAMEIGYDEDPGANVHIGRVIHYSAGKMGAMTPAEIYGEGSEIIYKDVTKLRSALAESSMELPWSGYGTQQETPTHFGHESQTNVVQADKSILGGFYDENFQFKGKEISGEKLDAIKSGINAELSRRAKEIIDSTLKTDGKFDIEKIVDKAIKVDSGVSNNDANSALAVDKYGLPIFWSHSKKVIEEFLFSQYSDVIRLQRPGRANPQFPIVGKGKVNASTELDPNTGIVMLNGRSLSEPLKYTKVTTNKDGKLEVSQVAEIVVPFDFISMGGSVDINSIDLNNIDPSLLKIIGMRLPNQLHQSQVLFKIVGFTPKGMGTMVIVPQEIVVQTGSDFDIDKLYQYWRNAYLTKDKKLVGTPSNIVSYDKLGRVVVDEKAAQKFIDDNFEEGSKPDIDDVLDRAIENDYIEIFESVLSNGVVAQMALEALDANDLKDAGAKYLVLKPKAPWYSRQRQNEEYRLQQSAKEGINIYAKGMSSFILTDRKNMAFDKNRVMSKLRQKGEISPLLLRFINPYGKSTINGENRTSLRNIVILLSEAIDNAKNGNLIPNGLNDSTFNIAATLVILADLEGNALSLENIPALLNQEVIKRTSDLVNNSSGVVKPFGRSFDLFTAARMVLEDLSNEMGVSDEAMAAARVKAKTATYDEADLYAIYNTGQQILEGGKATEEARADWLAAQEDIMDNIFKPLSSMSGDIFSLTSSVGFDRGFAPTSAENNYTLNKIFNSGKSNKIENDETYTKLTNGENNTTGNNLIIAEDVIEDVDNVLGLSNKTISLVIDKITKFKGVYGKRKTVEITNAAIEGYKSYVFSKVIRESFGVTRSIQELGKDISAMVRIYKNSTNSKYKNNKFLRSININKDNTFISFNGDLKNNADLEKSMDGFYELAKDTDDGARKLAHNIIMYEFLTNGNKTRSSFIKVIPVEILEDIGFYEKLADKVRELSSGAHVDDYVNLFYRNNPQYIPSFDSLKGYTFNTFNGVKFNKHEVFDRQYASLGKSVPKYTDIPFILKDNSATKEKFIYIFDSVQRSGDNYYALYKKYDLSILRGSALYSSTKLNSSKKKLFNTGFFTDYASDNLSNQFFIGGATHMGSFSEDFNIEKTYFLRMLHEQTDVRSLMPVITQIGTTYSEWMVSLMKALPDHMLDVPVRYVNAPSESNSIAEFNIRKGKGEIVIYNQLFESEIDRTASIEFAKQTILHEVQHSIMAESYNLGKNGDVRFAKIAENVDDIFSDAKEILKDEIMIDPLTGEEIVLNEEGLTYGKFMKKGNVDYAKIDRIFAEDPEMKDKVRRAMYMLNNQMDFIAEVSSRKHIQTMMNSLSLSEATYQKLDVENTKSILSTLFSKFADFFGTIVKFFNGGEMNSKSILEGVMMQNAMLTGELMNMKSRPKSTKLVKEKYAPYENIDSQPLSSTVREFLQGASASERSAFRYALNNNIFKTKCE